MDAKTGAISSALNSLTREYETITNNLANVNTVGFKRQSNSFSKSLSALQDDGNDAGKVNTAFDFSQGSLTYTGSRFDMGLSDKGFFVVETPDGPLYTRNGMFHVNNKGYLVDMDERTIAGKDGPLIFPQDMSIADMSVSEDGVIQVKNNTVGQLKLVSFGENEAKLTPIGKNCFAAPQGITPEAAKVSVKQGYQEASNVVAVEELVDLITVTRLYQSNMKLLTSDGDNSKSLLGVAMG
ncbi:MAG: flagellar hook basal-body protein [Sedimentisphaerales bacterium]|nr:flagellar hook basal-body protein [Sedimentisphaerales bacterium]